MGRRTDRQTGRIYPCKAVLPSALFPSRESPLLPLPHPPPPQSWDTTTSPSVPLSVASCEQHASSSLQRSPSVLPLNSLTGCLPRAQSCYLGRTLWNRARSPWVQPKPRGLPTTPPCFFFFPKDRVLYTVHPVQLHIKAALHINAG